jgi:hypothetical protein
VLDVCVSVPSATFVSNFRRSDRDISESLAEIFAGFYLPA